MTMTRHTLLGSLRALAASHRRGYLAGSTAVVDRDLDRISFDLLATSQVDGGRLAQAPSHEVAADRPVDLHAARQARGSQPSLETVGAAASHARAS